MHDIHIDKTYYTLKLVNILGSFPSYTLEEEKFTTHTLLLFTSATNLQTQRPLPKVPEL